MESKGGNNTRHIAIVDNDPMISFGQGAAKYIFVGDTNRSTTQFNANNADQVQCDFDGINGNNENTAYLTRFRQDQQFTTWWDTWVRVEKSGQYKFLLDGISTFEIGDQNGANIGNETWSGELNAGDVIHLRFSSDQRNVRLKWERTETDSTGNQIITSELISGNQMFLSQAAASNQDFQEGVDLGRVSLYTTRTHDLKGGLFVAEGDSQSSNNLSIHNTARLRAGTQAVANWQDFEVFDPTVFDPSNPNNQTVTSVSIDPNNGNGRGFGLNFQNNRAWSLQATDQNTGLIKGNDLYINIMEDVFAEKDEEITLYLNHNSYYDRRERGNVSRGLSITKKIIDNEPTLSFNKDEVLEITEGTTKALEINISPNANSINAERESATGDDTDQSDDSFFGYPVFFELEHQSPTLSGTEESSQEYFAPAGFRSSDDIANDTRRRFVHIDPDNLSSGRVGDSDETGKMHFIANEDNIFEGTESFTVELKPENIPLSVNNNPDLSFTFQEYRIDQNSNKAEIKIIDSDIYKPDIILQDKGRPGDTYLKLNESKGSDYISEFELLLTSKPSAPLQLVLTANESNEIIQTSSQQIKNQSTNPKILYLEINPEKWNIPIEIALKTDQVESNPIAVEVSSVGYRVSNMQLQDAGNSQVRLIPKQWQY